MAAQLSLQVLGQEKFTLWSLNALCSSQSTDKAARPPFVCTISVANIFEIHHHGLQYVDKKFVIKETFCSLHQAIIKDGQMFHCFACNFFVCADCMEEDCRYCKRNICTHKNILIIVNQDCRNCKKNSYTHNILIIINHKVVFYAIF